MNAAPVIQMHCCKILFCDITSLFEDIKVDEKQTTLSQNKQQKKQREEERNPETNPDPEHSGHCHNPFQRRTE